MALSDQSAAMPQDAPPKRRPGRPKGSKNKPKSPVDQVAADLRGNGDEAPRRRKKRVSKKTTEAIEEALAEILTAPSMATAIIGDEWATQHFIQNGRELAHRIAVVSERHSQLRKWCEAMLEGESVMVVAIAAFAYVFPPLVHYNIVPAPDLLGIPKRPTTKRPRKVGDSPTTGTEWEQDPLREQAQSMMEAENERRAAEAAAANGTDPVFSEDDPQVPPTFVE